MGGHFLPVQESVIFIRDLIAKYVILCSTGKQSRDSYANQGSEGFLIQLQRDDRGTKELSRPILK